MLVSPWLPFVDGPPPLPESPYAGVAAVPDTDLPSYDGEPVRVLVSSGAGGLAGPLSLCVRRGIEVAALDVAALDVDVRDDTDPAGNAALDRELPVSLHGGTAELAVASLADR